MSCEEFELQVDAYLDGALDADAARQLEQHLGECPACSALVTQVRQLREVVGRELRSVRAPEHLRGAVSAELRRAARSRPLVAWRLGGALAAGLFLGVVGGWQLGAHRSAVDADAILGDAVVSAHIRALQPNHLTDVASSEHHTVKPWFAGKLDFAPPVPDLGADGYPLIGGRLDVIGQRTVAALAYARGGHVIDVFLWPGEAAAAPHPMPDRRGFSVLRGSAGAMNFWIVSDVNPVDLAGFARLIERELSGGSPSH